MFYLNRYYLISFYGSDHLAKLDMGLRCTWVAWRFYLTQPRTLKEEWSKKNSDKIKKRYLTPLPWVFNKTQTLQFLFLPCKPTKKFSHVIFQPKVSDIVGCSQIDVTTFVNRQGRHYHSLFDRALVHVEGGLPKCCRISWSALASPISETTTNVLVWDIFNLFFRTAFCFPLLTHFYLLMHTSSYLALFWVIPCSTTAVSTMYMTDQTAMKMDNNPCF